MVEPNLSPGKLLQDEKFKEAFNIVIAGLTERDSYHAQILKDALATEIDRGKTYTHKGAGNINWDPFEMIYLYGAVYKVMRTMYACTDPIKALDDMKDAYNYCGLFYRRVIKNRLAGTTE